MSIEKNSGVHSCERSQVDRKKTTADQLAEHCKLYGDKAVDSYIVEDVSNRSKVKVIEQ